MTSTIIIETLPSIDVDVIKRTLPVSMPILTTLSPLKKLPSTASSTLTFY